MERKTVLILGATSDIAIALAHQFAKLGYNLQLAARDLELLNKIKTDLKLRYYNNITVFYYDTLELNKINLFFNQLPTIPNVVVLAIGILHAKTEQHNSNNILISPDQAEALTVTNFLGPMLALDYLASKLAGLNQQTTIIAISSVAGDRGRAKNYWYGATKAALTAGLSGLRQQYWGTNLLVITVKPGFVLTKMTSGLNLPKFLTKSPEQQADLIIKAFHKRKPVVYDWKWRIIMLIIRMLPEKIFLKLKF